MPAQVCPERSRRRARAQFEQMFQVAHAPAPGRAPTRQRSKRQDDSAMRAILPEEIFKILLTDLCRMRVALLHIRHWSFGGTHDTWTHQSTARDSRPAPA